MTRECIESRHIIASCDAMQSAIQETTMHSKESMSSCMLILTAPKQINNKKKNALSDPTIAKEVKHKQIVHENLKLKSQILNQTIVIEKEHNCINERNNFEPDCIEACNTLLQLFETEKKTII